jgi:hypothetical protein
MGVYPSILPNIDVFPITHIPIASFFKDPTSLLDALPCVARPLPLFGLKKSSVREVFGF